MSFRFHPGKNIHEDASKMMGIINEAKEGMKITLHNNDAIREEGRVRMSEKTIILLSDDNYNSETREISSKTATSSNKASIFPAEHSYDNGETPFKKNMLDHGHQKKNF